MTVDPSTGWTGRTACALQAALRMTNEAFAEHLGVAVRTVAAWHQKPALRPKSEMQRLLDTALERAPAVARERFAALAADPAAPASEPSRPPGPAVQQHPAAPPQPTALPAQSARLDTDPAVRTALDWLDRHAGRRPGTSRTEVEARLAGADTAAMRARRYRRERLTRQDTAAALGRYYASDDPGYGRYAGRYGAQPAVTTSVLTRPGWLDLRCPLRNGAEQITVSGASVAGPAALDEEAAGHAAQRLAELLVANGRMIDLPLYRLTGVRAGGGTMTARFAMSHFLRYALTFDLLERELLDALADGKATGPGTLPLRDRLLPDRSAVVNVADRLCAGGALSLCAVARPGAGRRPPDYLLLVQERSAQVVNASRRLSVIPKGFHQPMADLTTDAYIAATLRREMEEELFGRDDIDNTLAAPRTADPMHPARLSEPLRWLEEDPARLRMECTAFGLNLVSGNYEFACLIVIEDEEFWNRFGGTVEANWEATSLRQYSTNDPELVGDLVQDRAWSNEGIFAFLQGLRRLQEIGGDRVNLPAIEQEMR